MARTLHGAFDEIFAPFQECTGLLDIVPSGIITLPAVDNCIEYEHGTGFGGLLPEFHGHMQAGVAFLPMFCPWCVFNEDLLPAICMQ